MAPRPLSSQPLPARLSNQPPLSQPTCRDPSISGPPPHPIQVATPSIVKPAVGKREPWVNLGTTSPGRRQDG